MEVKFTYRVDRLLAGLFNQGLRPCKGVGKMKKTSLVLGIFVAVFVVSPVVGQQLYIGGTGGINRADMSILGDGVEQTVNPRNLWSAGGVLGIQFNNHIALQLRPLYINKGGTLDQNSPSPDIGFQMSFFELDLSLKAAFGKQFRPYIVAGPSIGFPVTAEAGVEVTGNTLKADIKNILKSIEYSLGIGGGIELSLWKGFLFLEGRYQFGLNNLNKGGLVEFKLNGTVVATQTVGADDEYKNRGIQIMAGYAFSLDKD
jgi:hypothetical protein